MTLLTYHSKYVVQSTTAVSTTSSTLQDDTYASQTFTLDSTKTVLVIYTATSAHNASGVNAQLTTAISINDTTYSQMYDSGKNQFGLTQAAIRNTCHAVVSLAAGTHTIKGKFAAFSSGVSTAVSSRTLLIYILNGNEFSFVDDSTAQTTSSTSYVNDNYAVSTFTPSSNCIALILYSVSTTTGSEYYTGKKTCIRVGSTDYVEGEAQKSSRLNDLPDSQTTTHALNLGTDSVTVRGRFANGSSRVDRHVLSVLLFDQASCAFDLTSSTTQVSSTSTSLSDDTQASITRNTAGELLVLAQATKINGTTASDGGMKYGIEIDNSDVSYSSSSPGYTDKPESNFVAYAQTVESGDHTITGRLATNNGTTAVKVDTRILIALWFSTSSSVTKTFSSSNDILISKQFTSENDLLISKSFSSYNDIHLSKVFQNENDIIISKSFQSVNDIGINKTFQNENDILLSKVFSSSNDILISKQFTSENDLLISKTFSSYNDIHLSKSFQNENDIFIQKVFSSDSDIIINKLFISQNSIISEAITKTFSSSNDILISKGFTSSNDILISKSFQSTNDINLNKTFQSVNDIFLQKIFSSSNDLLLSKVFQNENDILISKIFSSINEILSDSITKTFSSSNDILISKQFSSENDILLQKIFSSSNAIYSTTILINYDLPLTVVLTTYPRTLTLSQNIRTVDLL